jgi:hypothetical protein
MPRFMFCIISQTCSESSHCVVFMQHKNKMHSQTQPRSQKNITFVQLHVSIHTESSSGLHTKLLKHNSPSDSALYCSGMSLILFLKIWHCSVAHVNFCFFLKFSSNVVPRWRYIFIKIKICNWCNSVPNV